MTDTAADPRRHAPATERNREPIRAVLADILPARGLVLEIASGTGEHAAYFAPAFPGLTWQPSDPDPDLRASIAAWREHSGANNIEAPIDLDTTAERWPVEAAEAILCCNMIHIAPWEAAEGLFAGAGRILAKGGPLILYGPFKRGGEHTAPSNARFDASLQAQDPRWGVRDLDDVTALAEANGLAFDAEFGMPANNLTIVYRRL